MEYTITIEALRAAANTARAAGEQAAGVPLGASADAVAQAMPGSRSAAAATELAERWRSRLTGWSGDVAEHGEALDASAAQYQDSEDQAEQDLRHASDRLPAAGR
ncbi:MULTISPECIES: hypothetical protein [Actinoalloteichus]|uniref:Excreted virulence factor EspC (Type VII ESX diderm) n=1 Tax=Actinoalloteichus fjordicus TaxID=1612552 RepID=A0AAC9PQF3_9PSEU|nr:MULTISPECIES: hypothetical protein [Actinoalloteichus]APU12968.1 hypothetical protein UA74_04445 [Actinoalloteichus fjordicus]APU18939.1 hypothetical protein UA75_04550 [Actinoalloteichus sp. GBA129-24]